MELRRQPTHFRFAIVVLRQRMVVSGSIVSRGDHVCAAPLQGEPPSRPANSKPQRQLKAGQTATLLRTKCTEPLELEASQGVLFRYLPTRSLYHAPCWRSACATSLPSSVLIGATSMRTVAAFGTALRGTNGLGSWRRTSLVLVHLNPLAAPQPLTTPIPAHPAHPHLDGI
eukprot:3694341-Rhodomonas_salina.2